MKFAIIFAFTVILSLIDYGVTFTISFILYKHFNVCFNEFDAGVFIVVGAIEILLLPCDTLTLMFEELDRL